MRTRFYKLCHKTYFDSKTQSVPFDQEPEPEEEPEEEPVSDPDPESEEEPEPEEEPEEEPEVGAPTEEAMSDTIIEDDVADPAETEEVTE